MIKIFVRNIDKAYQCEVRRHPIYKRLPALKPLSKSSNEKARPSSYARPGAFQPRRSTTRVQPHAIPPLRQARNKPAHGASSRSDRPVCCGFRDAGHFASWITICRRRLLWLGYNSIVTSLLVIFAPARLLGPALTPIHCRYYSNGAQPSRGAQSAPAMQHTH